MERPHFAGFATLNEFAQVAFIQHTRGDHFDFRGLAL